MVSFATIITLFGYITLPLMDEKYFYLILQVEDNVNN